MIIGATSSMFVCECKRQSISLCTLEEVARLKPSPTTTRTRSRTGRSTLPVGIFLERPIACHKNSTAIWFASGGGGPTP